MNKVFTVLVAVLLVLTTSAGIALAKGGSSGSGGDGDDRVRVEVRTGDDEPGENRVRVELRGEGVTIEDAMNLVNSLSLPEDVSRFRIESRDGERVRIEVRAGEEEELLPNFEIEGNTFEITGTVSTFTGGSVTIGGQTITINPDLVANFEQEGTIEVGEMIKVEGIVADDGALLAREIKADGLEVEDEGEVSVSGASLSGLLDQIITFFQSLI
ncbi:hypothetical protein HYU45_03535 [Candidatus Daviesbacteria bacterium]|nr:hypothetical protein [Candidatus Daviesbacteria bacterium]